MPCRLASLSVASIAAAAFAGPLDELSPASGVRQFLPESLPALASPAYYGDLEKARASLHFGRYRAALYASFNLPNADAADVSLLRAEAYWRMGQTDLARATLAANGADSRVSLLLARIDLDDARPSDAVARLKPLVDADPHAVAPRHYLAQAYEASGKLEAAVALDRYFSDGDDSVFGRFTSGGAAVFESAEDLTLAADSIDRWAAVTGQYATHPELHDSVLSMFVAAYDVVDRDYWPAHIAAARYLYAHGNKTEATKELEQANAANPNAPEVNTLLAEIAIDGHSDAGVEGAITALRAINPTSVTADLFDTRLKLSRRSFEAARSLAEAAVIRQPKNLEALAVLAAVHAARGNVDAMNATLARIDVIAPRDAAGRMLVAQTLSTVYYDSASAVALLAAAVDRAPWWTAPQHALGVALIQEGEEERARLILDKAYAVDPYNLITVNYLRVLDMLAKFDTSQSARFIFKYADVDDPIVPLYLGPEMDGMYDDLVKQFRFEPPKRPIVEVFPDAQSFSVRTAGQLGLETYGASLGRVMTVVAPRAGQTLGPFNWARVLRHEFTHTINLMQTHGRVPRWLTEGLAVWEERVPYRFAWVPEALYNRAIKDEMFTPREAALALTKPKDPHDGEIAYMTGFWVVRYIDESFGWEAVLKLLGAYGDGKSDDDAFTSATGMNVAVFHEKFSAWSKDQVASWGYDAETKKRVETMIKNAESLTRGAAYEKAAEAWLEIAKMQPRNPLPPRRLAGIYLALKRPADALPQLLATLPLELQDDRFAKRVARIYDDVGDFTNALKFANAAIGIDPYDADAHDLLSMIAQKAGDAGCVKQETQVAALLRKREAKK